MEEKYFIHPSSYVDEGAEIGEGTRIWHFCHIQGTARIGRNCSLGQNVNVAGIVGNGCRIQNNVSIYEGVELEDNVFCGPSCVFTNVTVPRAAYPVHGQYKKTVIREGASLGANCTVVCGHTVGRCAMIAAGAVVTHDVPDFALMAGVPARQIGWVDREGHRTDRQRRIINQNHNVMKKTLLTLAGISLSIILGSSVSHAQEQQGGAAQAPAVTEAPATLEELADDGTPVKNRVVTKGFWSNWSLTADLGIQFYYGENEKYMKFKDQLTFPAFDIYLNKWATPSFGWGLGFSGYKMKGIYQPENDYAAFQTKDFYLRRDGQDYYWQRGSWINPFAYFTLDLASIFNGYKPNRFWEPQIYAGGGIAIGFDSQFNRTAPTFNAGFINNFRLTDKLALVVNLRGALVGDDFDGESRGQEPRDMRYIFKNIPLDGIFGATVGLRIKFGERKHQTFLKASEYEELIDAQKEEISRLEGDSKSIADREKELREQLAKTQSELDALLTLPKQKDLDFQYHINFDLDKTNLTNREVIDLQYIADVMKLDENKKFYLIGYADKQTGSAKHNVWLSQHRVDNVFDCLTKTYGVNPAQLVKSYEGGVDTMFLQDNTLSRCVVIYSQGLQK